MGFAARYDNRSKYLNEIDEIIIPFHDRPDNLSEFLEQHKDQRVIIDLREGWKPFYKVIFTAIWEKHQNLALRVPKLNMDVCVELQQIHIPYFSLEVAIEWETFYYLAEFGVSDIYIGGQLGFELKDVAAAAAKKGIRTRVYPNLAQSVLRDTDALINFFIRPEDIDLYNRRYVSTFEFFTPNDIDINWDVLYRAYAINKKWLGPLNEIVLNLDTDIDNTYIHPHWGEFRMNCKRKCLKYESCDMCNQLYDFGKSLRKIEVMPNRPKDSKLAAKMKMQEIDQKKMEAEPPLPPPQVPNF